ncbi:hypothetical protein ACJQWK_01724 [Exserohilum turcicum]
MSGPDAPEPASDLARPPKRDLASTTHDHHDRDLLDAIFKRIKLAVPRTPYVLSTPSLHPYHYHSQQQANAWMIGRLWRSDEEHLQYRTYLYREPCQDCFELQAGPDDEPEPEPEPEPPRSHTANGQPAKKKPNLSAFKVKHANGTVTPGANITLSGGAPAKNTSEHPSTLTKSDKPSTSAQKADPRSPRSSSDALPDNHRPGKATQHVPYSGSRPRAPSTTQKSDNATSKGHGEKSDPSNSTPHGLPPLLSPVREPLGNPYGLPTILSPTLPSNVQAELDRLEMQRKRADSDASVSSSSDPRNQALAVPPEASHKSSGTAKVQSRGRSVSLNGKSPNPEPVSLAQQAHTNMIVKLKFSKSKAQVVNQILRLPPKRSNAEKKERNDAPKAAAPESQPKVTDPPVIKKKPAPKTATRRAETAASAPTSTPSTVAKPAQASAKAAEKRLRPDEDGSLPVPPAKRPRPSSTQETPAPSTASLAVPNKPLAQKSNPHHPTPKKDNKSVSMLRSQSSESNDATPGRSGATPAGSRTEPKAGPTSAPLNSKKQVDIALLGQTSAKLNQTGRALKHEATKILNNASSKKDEKRAAVTNLECIL